MQGIIVFSMLLILVVIAAKVIGTMFEDAAKGAQVRQEEDTEDSDFYDPDNDK